MTGIAAQTSAFTDSYPTGTGDLYAEPTRLTVTPEPSAIRLPVVYEASRPLDEASDCEGAQTLRLVEDAVRTMQELRGRADHISSQALNLIHLTHRERAQMQAELQVARSDASAWERRARASEEALGRATMLIRKGDFARSELELVAQEACDRADAAEARVKSLEHYLKEIRAFLEARMMIVRR